MQLAVMDNIRLQLNMALTINNLIPNNLKHCGRSMKSFEKFSF